MNSVKIIIDKELMNQYESVYFKLYPKCRKFPKYFTNPIPLSWNAFIVKKRMEQNTIKQKYKDFGVWLAKLFKIDGLNLDKVTFTYDFYFGNRQRHDIDNYTLTQKLLGDAFVCANVLKDDNSNNLWLKFNPFKYDKLNPRVEILIEYDNKNIK
jgi:hypothetical protein